MGASESCTQSWEQFDDYQSLIELSVKIMRRLKKLSEADKEIIEFIEKEWLPQRNLTIKKLKNRIKAHKMSNTALDVIQIPYKIYTASGMLIMLGGIAFPPVAIGGGMLAAVCGAASAAIGLVKRKIKKGSIKRTKRALLADLDHTNQLKELLSNFESLFNGVESCIKKIHLKARSGAFDRILLLPSVQETISLMKKMDEITPEGVAEILKSFGNVLRDAEFRRKFYEGLRYKLVQETGSSEIFSGSLDVCLAMLGIITLMTVVNPVFGLVLISALDILSLWHVSYSVGKAIVRIAEGGIDSVVIEMKKIVERLEEERNSVEHAVKWLKDKESEMLVPAEVFNLDTKEISCTNPTVHSPFIHDGFCELCSWC